MNLFAAAAALLPTDAQINSLLRGDAGDENVSPILQGGMFTFVKEYDTPKGVVEREYNLALYADKLFPPSEVEASYNAEVDAVHPSIEDSGRPGTSARIDAYREWYASKGETSPNEGILDSDSEADALVINLLSLKGTSPTDKLLKAWMFELATECHRGVLNAE